MKNPITQLFNVICLCLLPLLYSSSAVADKPWINQFALEIEQANEIENIPGYAFAIVEPNAQVTMVTHGLTHAEGTEVDKDTLFRLASVSKTFNSVLTERLVNQGELSWGLTLQQLVPEVRFSPKLSKTITLEHIVSQSSGYMPNAYDNLIEANYSVDRVLRELAKLEPICSPGKCYTYQNALFAAVEQGINRQTKGNYQSLMQEQVFTPLNMDRASVGLKSLVEDDNWARPHVLIKNGDYKQTRVKRAYYRYAPASGVNASIKDMTKWLKLMLGHYPEVLSKEQISGLLQPKTTTKKELRRRHWRDHLRSAHYGLGWRVYDFDGELLIHHGGWVSGYRADVTFAPEHGIGMAFLMNAESNLINQFSVDFWDGVFKSAKQRERTSQGTKSAAL